MAKAYSELDSELIDDFEFEFDLMEEQKSELMYLLIKETNMDTDDVYSLVYHDGSKITWQ